MINVGLTSVADHPELAKRAAIGVRFRITLSNFPVLELDTTFYGSKVCGTGSPLAGPSAIWVSVHN